MRKKNLTRFVSALLAGMMLLSSAATIFAEEGAESTEVTEVLESISETEAVESTEIVEETEEVEATEVLSTEESAEVVFTPQSTESSAGAVVFEDDARTGSSVVASEFTKDEVLDFIESYSSGSDFTASLFGKTGLSDSGVVTTKSDEAYGKLDYQGSTKVRFAVYNKETTDLYFVGNDEKVSKLSDAKVIEKGDEFKFYFADDLKDIDLSKLYLCMFQAEADALFFTTDVASLGDYQVVTSDSGVVDEELLKQIQEAVKNYKTDEEAIKEMFAIEHLANTTGVTDLICLVAGVSDAKAIMYDSKNDAFGFVVTLSDYTYITDADGMYIDISKPFLNLETYSEKTYSTLTADNFYAGIESIKDYLVYSSYGNAHDYIIIVQDNNLTAYKVSDILSNSLYVTEFCINVRNAALSDVLNKSSITINILPTVDEITSAVHNVSLNFDFDGFYVDNYKDNEWDSYFYTSDKIIRENSISGIAIYDKDNNLVLKKSFKFKDNITTCTFDFNQGNGLYNYELYLHMPCKYGNMTFRGSFEVDCFRDGKVPDANPIDTEKATVSFSGFPEVAYNGSSVTLKMSTSKDCTMSFNGSVLGSGEYGNSFEFTVDNNGSYSYTATTKSGVVTEGTLDINFFKVEDEDSYDDPLNQALTDAKSSGDSLSQTGLYTNLMLIISAILFTLVGVFLILNQKYDLVGLIRRRLKHEYN